jgi:hypothetical protein
MNNSQRKRRHGLLTLAKTGQFRGVTPRLLPMLGASLPPG